MTPKLSAEQCEAVDHSDGPIPVEDERTHRRYFLVDATTFNTLRRQEDHAAIGEGIADMEAGRVAPREEVLARVRSKLGLTIG